MKIEQENITFMMIWLTVVNDGVFAISHPMKQTQYDSFFLLSLSLFFSLLFLPLDLSFSLSLFFVFDWLILNWCIDDRHTQSESIKKNKNPFFRLCSNTNDYCHHWICTDFRASMCFACLNYVDLHHCRLEKEVGGINTLIPRGILLSFRWHFSNSSPITKEDVCKFSFDRFIGDWIERKKHTRTSISKEIVCLMSCWTSIILREKKRNIYGNISA